MKNKNKINVINQVISIKMPIRDMDGYPLSMQSKKIFCAYHETQFLTNFCQQKQCLMPLCPSCIAQHTQQHFRQGKKPSYTSISQSLNRAKQSCYCTIVTLQQYKKLNHDIYDYISTMQQNIHMQLLNKRNMLFDMITQMFNDYQQRLMKQIYANYKQKNVYLLQQALNANQFIDEEITNLYEKISLLKSDDCLSSLITYYAVDQVNYHESLEEFDQYFEKNRKAGKIEISINDDELKRVMANLCESLINVECIIENFQEKPPQQQETPRLKSKRYGFNKDTTTTNGESENQLLAKSKIDKENDENNMIKESRAITQRSGKISRQQQQEKEISFNNMQQPEGNKNVAGSRAMNSSINESMNQQRKSIAQSGITAQDEKRLTREFKKL